LVQLAVPGSRVSLVNLVFLVRTDHLVVPVQPALQVRRELLALLGPVGLLARLVRLDLREVWVLLDLLE